LTGLVTSVSTLPFSGPRRIASLSVHTSPLDQPGTGDAGGLNVYVVEVAKRLAELGTEVEIFTRAVCRDTPPLAELVPGVLVRSVVAGPFEEMDKTDLPGQVCQFTLEVLRAEAAAEPGKYDLVHAHYWLSGKVGAAAKERWGVPLVQSMHTLGKVKNAALAAGAAGYVLKDATPDQVEQAIRLAAHGDMYLDPAVAGGLTSRLVAGTGLAALTEQERNVLALVAQGLSNREIGTRLHISESTVRSHMSSVLAKLNLTSRTQAALLAVREGLARLNQR